jgi:hypothetical protein
MTRKWVALCGHHDIIALNEPFVNRKRIKLFVIKTFILNNGLFMRCLCYIKAKY